MRVGLMIFALQFWVDKNEVGDVGHVIEENFPR